MDNVYSNSEIVFAHLGEKQEAGFFKGSQDFVYANAAEQMSRGTLSSPAGSSPPSTAGTSGAPCRCAQVLLAVLCLALLSFLVALGIMYIEKSNRSQSLEEENSDLSISLSTVEQRLADLKKKLEELQVQHTDLLRTMSNYTAKEACVCPSGWKIHQGNCYYFSTEKMNWEQSQQYCTSKNAHLAIVKNQQQQTFLSSNVHETHWIGLSDLETEGQWVWVDNTPFNTSGIQFWWSKEPDNWTGGGDRTGEDCGSLGDENGNYRHWFDASCSKIKKFVCETSPRI